MEENKLSKITDITSKKIIVTILPKQFVGEQARFEVSEGGYGIVGAGETLDQAFDNFLEALEAKCQENIRTWSKAISREQDTVTDLLDLAILFKH